MSVTACMNRPTSVEKSPAPIRNGRKVTLSRVTKGPARRGVRQACAIKIFVPITRASPVSLTRPGEIVTIVTIHQPNRKSRHRTVIPWGPLGKAVIFSSPGPGLQSPFIPRRGAPEWPARQPGCPESDSEAASSSWPHGPAWACPEGPTGLVLAAAELW